MIGSRDGNAYFVGVAPSVKVSDKLTLTVESSYMNAEYKGIVAANDITTQNIFELGGIASYMVTEGAFITALLGYLNIEDARQNPVAFGLALDLTF